MLMKIMLIYQPPSTPYVIMRTSMFGERVLRKKAKADHIAPTIATGLHPNLFANAADIGPVRHEHEMSSNIATYSILPCAKSQIYPPIIMYIPLRTEPTQAVFPLFSLKCSRYSR